MNDPDMIWTVFTPGNALALSYLYLPFAILSTLTRLKAMLIDLAQYFRFTEEIAPVSMKTKKGVVEMSVDEHPRPDVTAAGMAKLPPVFKKNGTVTAANASGLSWFLFVGNYNEQSVCLSFHLQYIRSRKCPLPVNHEPYNNGWCTA